MFNMIITKMKTMKKDGPHLKIFPPAPALVAEHRPILHCSHTWAGFCHWWTSFLKKRLKTPNHKYDNCQHSSEFLSNLWLDVAGDFEREGRVWRALVPTKRHVRPRRAARCYQSSGYIVVVKELFVGVGVGSRCLSVCWIRFVRGSLFLVVVVVRRGMMILNNTRMNILGKE